MRAAWPLPASLWNQFTDHANLRPVCQRLRTGGFHRNLRPFSQILTSIRLPMEVRDGLKGRKCYSYILLHFDVTFSHTIKGQYSWGFLALLQYFLLKSPPSGGSRAATVRERYRSVRSGIGALQRRSVRAALDDQLK